MDDNIWNDRGADDFLRYIKHDFFQCVYLITHTMMTGYFFLNHSPKFSSFGKRDSWQMNYALAGLFFGRLNELITQAYGLSRGESIPKIRARSTLFNIYSRFFMWLMLLSVTTFTCWTIKESENFKNQNVLCKIWINIELIGLIVEIPYWYFQVEVMA